MPRKSAWRTASAAAVMAILMLVAPATGQGRADATSRLSWTQAGTTLSSYDFGALTPGTSTSIKFTLKNFTQKYSGKLRVRLAGSSAFAITSNGCNGKNLAPKAYCRVTVKYAPPSTSVDGALLSATRLNKPTISLSLSGGPGHVYWTASSDQGDQVFQTGRTGGSVVDLAGGASISSVAADEAYVYWVDGGLGGFGSAVKKVPVGGGTVTTLANLFSDTGRAVAVDGTNVYWLGSNGTVNEVPIGGGSVTTLATGQYNANALAADGTNVYWVNYLPSGGTVDAVPVGGGSVTTLASGQDSPYALAVDGTNVYWVNYSNEGTVNEVPVGGGSVTTLASGQFAPRSVAVDGANVYWVNQGAGGVDGSVNKVPLGGGTATTLAGNQSDPQAIAVDGAHVYWVNYATGAGDGTVNSVPVWGGSVTSLAASQNGPISVAFGP